MCDKKEEIQEDCSQGLHNLLHQGHQEQHQQQQNQETMHQPTSIDAYMAGGTSRSTGGLMFPNDLSQIFPWNLNSVHNFNQLNHNHLSPSLNYYQNDSFLLPQQPSAYGGGLFNRRPFAYDMAQHGGGASSSATPFGLQTDFQKMTAQEIMDAKALAASKSHSEAERRRRERINNHLNKLRSLLPNTTKTDKASLLAEVIQHVKELKRQTSIIAETSQLPTEIDELMVENASDDEDGKFVIKASLSCEDRPDLLPDLIKTLKSLKLRTLKAEITTLGGRVKNVLFITSEEEDNQNNISSEDHQRQYCINSIQEAFKAVMEKSNGDESASGSVKRQRTNVNILGT
ncbi:hypothetical protein Leryth_027189 [Lithospermum erythrorhizon]|nr:hypothetical protein Leryth_027189 [Lithospermum erythrorhizon]